MQSDKKRHLSAAVSRAMEAARDYVSGHNQRSITLEHLMLHLLDDPTVIKVIQTALHHDAADDGRCDGLTKLRGFLRVAVEPASEPGSGQSSVLTHREYGDISQSLLTCLDAADVLVCNRDATTIEVTDILVASFADPDAPAARFLGMLDLMRADFITAIGTLEEKSGSKTPVPAAGSAPSSEASILDSFCTDMAKEVDKGGLVFGRDQEVQDVLESMARVTKANVILVGPAGVGKTAIARAVNHRIVDGRVPAALRGCRMYSLAVADLVAGTQFRGDLESRIRRLMQELKERPGTILFIDEIHTLMGAGGNGSGSGGGLDAANMLKPLLSGDARYCRVLGATTFHEYRRHFQHDEAMVRRFTKVDVEEPTVTQAIAMLGIRQPELSRHHDLRYEEGTAFTAVTLTELYVRNQRLPDKALEAMDAAGARVAAEGRSLVLRSDIAVAVAKMARMPVGRLTGEGLAGATFATLESRLNQSVYGHGATIAAMTRVLQTGAVGFGGGGPLGSFLFYGRSGTGKTELAKSLAAELGVALVRLDMSEFSDRNSISNLIGAPSGYSGAERGGRLTEMVEQHPSAVVLLDEFEKAHRDIHNLFLQVMGDGILTDATGRRVDFTNTVIIMTANIGAAEMNRAPLGFGNRNSSPVNDALTECFSPEFLNRLDGKYRFNSLDNVACLSVINKALAGVKSKLSARNLTLSVAEGVYPLLVKQGFDHENGARPLNRLVQDRISAWVAQQMVLGMLKAGQTVLVETNADQTELVLSVVTAPNEMPPTKRDRKPVRA